MLGGRKKKQSFIILFYKCRPDKRQRGLHGFGIEVFDDDDDDVAIVGMTKQTQIYVNIHVFENRISTFYWEKVFTWIAVILQTYLLNEITPTLRHSHKY